MIARKKGLNYFVLEIHLFPFKHVTKITKNESIEQKFENNIEEKKDAYFPYIRMLK